MRKSFPFILPYSLKGNRLFYKYLFTHLLSMIVPLLIILLVFNLSFVKLIREQSIEAEYKNLTLIMNEIDSFFLQSYRIKEQIQVDRDLRPFRLIFDPIHGAAVINELSGYVAVDGDLESIILNFLADESYYFSNETTLEKKNLSSHFPLPPDLDWNEILLPEKREIHLIHDFTYYEVPHGDVLLISYPLYNVTRYGGVAFIISQEKILKTIPLVTDRNVSLKVRTDDSLPIIDTPSDEWDVSDAIVLKDRSSLTGLQYEMIFSRDFVFAPVDSVISIISWVIAIILILGAGTAVAGSLWNYHRLDSLREQLNEFPIHDGSSDVLDYIGNSLTEISQRLSESSRARKEAQIRCLLRGETSDDMIMEGNYLKVAVLDMPSSYHHSRRDLIIRLESLTGFPWQLHAVSDTLSGRIILLLKCSWSGEELFNKELKRLFLFLRNEIHTNITIGVSRTCQNIEELPRCKEEAIHLEEKRFISGKGKIYRWEETAGERTDRVTYPSALLQNYKSALLSKDKVKAQQAIEDLVGYALAKGVSIYMARGICYEMISIFMVALSSDPGNQKTLNNLSALDIHQFDTMGEFAHYLKLFLKENLEKDSKPTSHPMTDYVRDNFSDINFSLTHMGDAFDLTVPNLCHLFKEEVGTTVLDFTSRLRMGKARKLLEAGKLNIGEIAFEVGYANTNSFIRRFRQLNGTSPGEYRKGCRSRGNR